MTLQWLRIGWIEWIWQFWLNNTQDTSTQLEPKTTEVPMMTPAVNTTTGGFQSPVETQSRVDIWTDLDRKIQDLEQKKITPQIDTSKWFGMPEVGWFWKLAGINTPAINPIIQTDEFAQGIAGEIGSGGIKESFGSRIWWPKTWLDQIIRDRQTKINYAQEEIYRREKEKNTARLENDKAFLWAIDDLARWMPISKLETLYSDLSVEDRNTAEGLIDDLARWMPTAKIYDLYPELSYSIKNNLNKKYGKSFTEAMWFDKAREFVREHWSGWPLWPVIQWAADFVYWSVKWAEDITEWTIWVLDNLWGITTDKSLKQNILQTAKGGESSAFNVIFPRATAIFNSVAHVPWLNKANDIMWYVATDIIWENANKLPWLRHFQEWLTEAEKEEMNWIVWWIVLFWIMKYWPKTVAKIKTRNQFVNKIGIEINKVTNKMNQAVDKFTKLESETLQPEPLSASRRYAKFKSWIEWGKRTGQDINNMDAVTYRQFNKVFKPFEGKDTPAYTPKTPAGTTPWWTSSQVWAAVAEWWLRAKTKNWIKTKASELDPDTIKSVQSNPYVWKIWEDTMKIIDDTGVPTDIKQLVRWPLEWLGAELLKKIESEEARLSETWPLYQTVRADPAMIDMSPAKTNASSILAGNKITVWADGKLNFDKSVLSVPADMSAIQKIFDRINEATEMNIDAVLDLRTFASALTKRDQWWTTEGGRIVRDLRRAVDNVAKKNSKWLKELDEKYTAQLDSISEVKEWLFYKDAKRRWEVKDNFISILKNIWWRNRANMLARLEPIMPDLWARVEAINMIPKLAKVYVTPSGITKSMWWRAGWFIAWFWVGGWLWAIVWEKVAGIMWNKIFDGMKKDAIKTIVDKMTPEAQSKLLEINRKIEAKAKLTAEEKQQVIDLKNKIQKANEENLKSKKDKLELEKQDTEFRLFLENGDTWWLWLSNKPLNWDNINTFIAPWKKIISWPNGSVVEWQILEINKTKDGTNVGYSDSNNNPLWIKDIKNSKKPSIKRSKQSTPKQTQQGLEWLWISNNQRKVG